MRRYSLHMLTLVSAVVMLLLGALWLNLDGSVRNGTWIAPEPHITDYQAMVPTLPPVGSADTSRFIAMLERPVFSVTRRPPPPPPPPDTVQAPPPDHLSTARLSGIFQGDGVGGVIMLIAGKQRRAQLNDLVEGWTLTSVRGQTVTFMKGGQQRILTLERSLLQTASGAASPSGSAGGSSRVPRGGGAYPAPPSVGSVPAPAPAPSAFSVPSPAESAAGSAGSSAAAQPAANNSTSPQSGGARPPPVSTGPTFGGR